MSLLTHKVPTPREVFDSSLPNKGNEQTSNQLPKVGEWALLTITQSAKLPEVVDGRCTGASVETAHTSVYRAMVHMDPDTTPSHAVGYDAVGAVRYKAPRAPIYHLTEVILIESDGELMLDPQPDRIMLPNTAGHSLAPLDIPPAGE